VAEPIDTRLFRAGKLLSSPILALRDRRAERLDKYVFDHMPVLRPDEGIRIGFSPDYPRARGYQVRKV